MIKIESKVPFSHLDKVFWPEEQITKGELIKYYLEVSSFILPYLQDRPEILVRYPNGITSSHFYQKDISSYPDWIQTFQIEHKQGMTNYLLIQDLDSLLYAINLGCIDLNPFFSRIHTLQNPDFMVLDLDPENIPFEKVVEVALAIHHVLEKCDIVSVCKTSGSRGLHICIPLNAKYNFEQAKHLAQIIAIIVHKQLPRITSLERSPSKRQKKVYIDCFQNNFGQSLTAPYSVRARPNAPVSTPLEWSEVTIKLDPKKFNMQNTLKRLEKKGDLFKPILGKGVDFEKVLMQLDQKYF